MDAAQRSREADMKTMTALEAKNAFGQFLEAAQREPVTITRNGRDVGAMFSTADLRVLAGAYLSAPMLEAVTSGKISAGDALLRQAEMNRRLGDAEADIARGEVTTADTEFFERLKSQVRARRSGR
jgi:prevent-host-death family protein